MSNSLGPHGLYSPWNFPGQSTGVGSHSLLQRMFATQDSNSGLPHCGQILYQLSHQGGSRILEWVAYPFSSGSSRPRNQIGSPALQADFFLPAELPGKPTVQESPVQFLGWEDLLEKGMANLSSILPGESHGQRSLEGYSPRGHKESDMTERLTLYYC